MVLQNTPDDNPQNQELHFSSPVQNRRQSGAVVGLDLVWILSFNAFYYFLFALQWMKNQEEKERKLGGRKKKNQTSGTQVCLMWVCIPLLIYGTETEPHKWTRGSCSTARAPHRRRGKIKARQTLKTWNNGGALRIRNSLFSTQNVCGMSEYPERCPDVL